MSRFTLIDGRAGPGTPHPPPAREGLDRREALQWLATGSAVLLAGCEGKPPASVAPYVETPEGLVAGEVRRYRTTVPLAGYDRGVTGLCRDGRPVKLEGSPNHPASLGATDVFAEAEILGLYDPGRLRTPETAAGPQSWADFAHALAPRMARARSRGGEGLTIFTGRITSPTELRLLAALQSAMPAMKWRRWEPVDDDATRAGARLAFGRPLQVRSRLAECAAVLCLDADPLGPGPEQIANSRAFAEARRPSRTPFQRLYAVEPGWSLTGMNADHRLALRPALVTAFAYGVARELGLPAELMPHGRAPEAAAVRAVAADLLAAHGRAVVLAGPSQPPGVHALAHWMNARLGAPVDARAPLDPHPDDHGDSLHALADDLRVGRVETLLVIGANPAFGTEGFGGGVTERLLRAVPWTAALALSPDETASACQWRLPMAHPLESWGDGRAAEGTAAIRQPLVRPLHEGRTAAQLLAMLAGAAGDDPLALVRESWADTPAGSDAGWSAALTSGVVAGSAPAPVPLPPPRLPPKAPFDEGGRPEFELVLAPDPTIYDGRYASNAWLQECPKPLTHEVWGASLAISPEDAGRHGLKTGDHLRFRGTDITAPVRVTPGQAAGALSAFLGGGRRAAGPVGTGVGWNCATLPVRAINRERFAGAGAWGRVDIDSARGHGVPPTFSSTPKLESEARKLSPVMTAAGLHASGELDRTLRPPSLYPEPARHEPAWAMVIDANACTGCNACVVACQAENNVPVVGPREVARGRDMHWLRIDAYEVDGRPAFQPVPCMQCEHAPCEPVCPVEASVHDHEGLNGQVYNRCIGTRFCEANCPYQVRRFNFHGYAQEQAYADLGAESYAAGRNPDVTVRARGVMEKCTYCVQRISGARRAAEREGRPIAPGEVVTACQAACPTRAIRFGDLHAPGSQVAALRTDPRYYVLLGELGTRPRTTYLARVRNPNPALEPGA